MGACDLQPFSELQGGEESFPKGRDDGQTKTTAVHLIMRPLVVLVHRHTSVIPTPGECEDKGNGRPKVWANKHYVRHLSKPSVLPMWGSRPNSGAPGYRRKEENACQQPQTITTTVQHLAG